MGCGPQPSPPAHTAPKPPMASSSRAVVAASRPSFEADAYTGQLWRVPLDGGAPTRQTRGFSDSAPAISPDGSLLAFVRSAPGEAPVWAQAKGSAKGPTLSPLYRTAPQAALADPALHRLLALLDALRMGRARERALAADLLKTALEETQHESQ